MDKKKREEYIKAYVEVSEILAHLSEEELKKIPQSRIDYYNSKRSQTTYDFKLDPKKNLKEQNISIMANAIIVSLYRDYFATPKQREVLLQSL